MVSTTPRNNQDWGGGGTKYSDLSEYCPPKPWLSLFMYVYQSGTDQKGLNRIHYLYLYPSQRRTLHCTFGDGFSIESTKACKKVKNKKTNSYQRRTNDLLTRSSKTNYERTTGELTIWLTTDDCLTVTIGGSKRTNYWLRFFTANNITA